MKVCCFSVFVFVMGKLVSSSQSPTLCVFHQNTFLVFFFLFSSSSSILLTDDVSTLSLNLGISSETREENKINMGLHGLSRACRERIGEPLYPSPMNISLDQAAVVYNSRFLNFFHYVSSI